MSGSLPPAPVRLKFLPRILRRSRRDCRVGLLLACLGALTGSAFAQVAPPINYEPYTFTTLAGQGPGTVDGNGNNARFNQPAAATVDTAGNVYIADTANHVIRRITPAGDVTTFAGQPGSPGFGNGSGADVLFNQPAGIAIDSAGNVYVADRGNHVIRKITPAGDVSTLAGGAGAPGSTDSPNGTLASLTRPVLWPCIRPGRSSWPTLAIIPSGE